MGEITSILDQLRSGDAGAKDRLIPLVYEELRGMARSALRRERSGHSLQATDLVHESYLKLVAGADRSWEGRRHFFYAAAEAMRRVLIEHARSRTRVKRGGGRIRIDIASIDLAADHDFEQVLALDDAICRLESEDRQAADVVRLRFFAGLSVEETAEAMGISERTVKRDWAYARAWLSDALGLKNDDKP